MSYPPGKMCPQCGGPMHPSGTSCWGSNAKRPASCSACALSPYTRGFAPLQKGPSTTVVVGDYLSSADADASKAFSGGMGGWLANLLRLAGIKREAVSVTAAMPCEPMDAIQPGTKGWRHTPGDVARAALAECARQHLLVQIEQVSPSRIIAFGDLPLQQLTPRQGITVWRGSALPLKTDLNVLKVLPTVHPRELMKNSELVSVVPSDMRKQLTAPPEHYELFADHGALSTFTSLKFAFDFEWDRFENITLCGISDRFYTALTAGWGNGNISELRRIFENSCDLIGHNIIGADTRYFERLGWRMPGTNLEVAEHYIRLHDTMLKQHLVQPDMRHGLGFVASVFTNKPYWKDAGGEDEEDEAGNIIVTKAQWRTWNQVDAIPRALGGYGGCTSDDEAYRLYNARDTDASFQINHQLDTLLAKYGLESTYWNVSVPAALICRELNEHGIKIAPERVQDIRTDLTGKILTLEQTLPEGLRPYEKPVNRLIDAPAGTYKAKTITCKGVGKKRHEPWSLSYDRPPEVLQVACGVCGRAKSVGRFVEPKKLKVPGFERIVPWNSPTQVKAYAKRLGLPSHIDRKTKREKADVNARKRWGRTNPEFRILDKLTDYSTLCESFAKQSLASIDRMFFQLMVHGTNEGRLACKGQRRGIDLQIQNCFSADTEVLTELGWIRFDQYGNERVAQFDANTHQISLVEPSRVVRQHYAGDLLHISSKEQIDLLVTPDHECLYYNVDTNAPYKVPASAYPKGAHQPQGGQYVGGSLEFSPAQLTLIAALQADAYVRGNTIEWRFKKERKCKRLRWALESEGIAYVERSVEAKGLTNFRIRISDAPFLADKKVFGSWILELTRTSFAYLAEEIFHWDGCFTGPERSNYSSSIKSNIDWAQVLQALTGKRAHMRSYMPASGRPNWQIDVTKRPYSCTVHASTETVPYTGIVYCVTVPSGNIVTRRNNRVAITGNCPQEIKGIFLPDNPDWCFIELDYASGENFLTAHLAKDEQRMARLLQPGYSEHLELAKRLFGLPAETTKQQAQSQPGGDLYDIGKHINHGSNYGMSHIKLKEYCDAQGYFFSEKECKEFIQVGKQLNPRTAAWQLETQNFAKRDGWLANPFGRRRWFGQRVHTECLAFLPASTLSDIVLRCMVSHWPARFAAELSALGVTVQGAFASGWRLSIQVHDSLVLQGPHANWQEQAARTAAIMQQPWRELDGFSLGVELKVGGPGESWGELKKEKVPA